MNNIWLILLTAASLFAFMALAPDRIERARPPVANQENAPERNPSSALSAPIMELSQDPASGEPSDNGLTRNLHREFRLALERDPLVAINLARQFIFTGELDSNFRVEILKELKILQFTHPEVGELALEVLEKAPSTALFEEALTIKYASLEEGEFDSFLRDITEKVTTPEYQVILKKFSDDRVL